jgi:hypothetical protein
VRVPNERRQMEGGRPPAGADEPDARGGGHPSSISHWINIRKMIKIVIQK